MLEDKAGPQILDYLTEHPSEIIRIVGLPEASATEEIKKLSLELRPKISAAPKPPPPIGISLRIPRFRMPSVPFPYPDEVLPVDRAKVMETLAAALDMSPPDGTSRVMRAFIACAHKLGMQRVWTADQADQWIRDFGRWVTGDAFERWLTGDTLGLEEAVVLKAYQRAILNVARAWKSPVVKSKGRVAAPPPPEPDTGRAIVDAFIDKVLAKTGTRITRKNIFNVTGYKNQTEFLKFQRGEYSPKARKKFMRTLEFEPEEFLNRLKAFKTNNAT